MLDFLDQWFASSFRRQNFSASGRHIALYARVLRLFSLTWIGLLLGNSMDPCRAQTGSASAFVEEGEPLPVGEVRLTLPAPVGFVEGSRLSPKLVKSALAGLQPSVKLLGLYYETNTLAEIINQGFTKPSPFCRALLRKVFDTAPAAQTAFDTLVVNAKKEASAPFDREKPAIKSLFQHYEDSLRKESGTTGKVLGITTLGVLVEQPDSFAMTTLVNLNWSDGQSEITAPFAIVVIWLRVGKEHVDLIVAQPFLSASSVDVANRRALEWVGLTRKANQARMGAADQPKRVFVENPAARQSGFAQSPYPRAGNGNLMFIVKGLMSSGELDETGLSKLSESELAKLGVWLEGHTAETSAALAKENKVAFEDLLGAQLSRKMANSSARFRHQPSIRTQS